MIHGQFFSDQGELLITDAMRTESALERMRGLLGRSPLQGSEALWITPCNSVHSLFMGYPLDLVYLNRRLSVVKIIERMKPWRFSARPAAHSVIELAAGGATTVGITTGTQLVWQPCAG